MTAVRSLRAGRHARIGHVLLACYYVRSAGVKRCHSAAVTSGVETTSERASDRSSKLAPRVRFSSPAQTAEARSHRDSEASTTAADRDRVPSALGSGNVWLGVGGAGGIGSIGRCAVGRGWVGLALRRRHGDAVAQFLTQPGGCHLSRRARAAERQRPHRRARADIFAAARVDELRAARRRRDAGRGRAFARHGATFLRVWADAVRRGGGRGAPAARPRSLEIKTEPLGHTGR
jgi:hypothetical protein